MQLLVQLPGETGASKRGSPVQDVNSLFKGALLQRAILCPVDAVPCDGHKVTASGHGITKDGQMSVIDIGTVKLNDTSQLLEEGISGCLYAQNINGFNDVVAGCPGVVNAWHAHDLHQGSTALQLRHNVRLRQDHVVVGLRKKLAQMRVGKMQKLSGVEPCHATRQTVGKAADC